ncbi:uncharacterized protein LOC144642464 isoform X2 [Oculina patagonica]
MGLVAGKDDSNSILLTKKVRMKKANARGGKLVVTVPNEESSSSRLKPPVTVSQPRKIVRLNRKTESTNLEKVTVKSLDEIKREKEQRLQRESASAHARSHDSVQAGGSAEDTGKDLHISDHLSKAVKVKPARPHEPVAATQSESQSATSNSSAAKPKLMMKKLTIPLKALPAHTPSHCKVLPGKQPVSVANSSPAETDEIQDFDYSDSDSYDSNISDLDENLLLSENEELETKQNSQNHQDGKDDITNYGNFSPYVDYSNVPLGHKKEEQDDLISLHPDESLFDEEDEFSTNNNRFVRPRVLGRRSGSESKDLRAIITDRQKEPQESSSSNATTVIRSNQEVPQTDNRETQDQEQEKDVVEGKDKNVSPKSHHRERSENVSPRTRHRERNSTQKVSNRHEDARRGPKAPRGRGAHRNAVSRRGGRGARPGVRRESGSNVAVPSLLPVGLPAIPNLLNTGDGLLPLPGAGLFSQLRAQLNLGILNVQQKIQKTTAEILTNPPPVPGEHVPDNRQQPLARLGPQGPRHSSRINERHPSKRPQSSAPLAKNISPLMPDQFAHKAQVSSQKKTPASDGLPKWLQRTRNSADDTNDQQLTNETNKNLSNVETIVVKAGREASRYETTENAHQRDAVPAGFQNDFNSSTLSDVEKTRLARAGHSSTGSDSEMQTLTSKRKSPFHAEEVPHGGKIVVTTSPEGLPQPAPARVRKAHPKGYCFRQLDTGHCTASPCKYRHMSNQELLEYQRSQRLGNMNSQDHAVEAKPEVQVEQTTAIVQETQPEENVPAVSYQLVAELLTKKELGAAWQMIEKLCRTNKLDFDILRRTLVVCSEHLEEPDIAAKVACQAFDKIGERSGQQHRHDYTVLIKTLCHSGQYIRAYEMLDVMKRNNHKPTYEVFLDLVQASAKDPHWAFNLLDEIKRSGLFKSGICSDLILLGCNSGEHFIERTWLLFQEALQSQVHLSADAVQAMLFTLSQTNNWEKIMTVIPAYPDIVPIGILNTAVSMAPRKADWVQMIVGLLATSPAERLNELGPEVWNTFLSNCCIEHGNNMSFAEKIYMLMQQNGIPLAPQTTSNYMSALSHANNWSVALELFNAVHEDPKVLEQLQVLEGGLAALTTALSKAGAVVQMLTVVHFMLENQIKPDDSVLQSAVESLDKEKNYKGVHQFFHQLKAAGIVPPVDVLRQIVLSLEKWIENPTASIEPYMAMRRACAGNQSDAANKGEVSSSDKTSQNQSKGIVCRFFSTPHGCRNGDNCRFIHPQSSVELSANANPVISERTPGHRSGSVGHDQSGNPFVFKDPASLTGQAVGPVVFPPAHDQQHTATSSSSSIQVGVQNPTASFEPYMTGQAVGPGVFPPAHDQQHTATCSSSSIQVGVQNPTASFEPYMTGQAVGPVVFPPAHDQQHKATCSSSSIQAGVQNPTASFEPYMTGQAVGPGVFPPAHDQQHTATCSSSSIQAGVQNPTASFEPYMTGQAVGPVVFPPAHDQQHTATSSSSSIQAGVQNPTASIEPYMAMQRACAGKQSDAANKEEVPSSDKDTTSSEASLKSTTSQNQSKGIVCHFFSTPHGCRNGENCRFIHPQSSVALPENANPVMSERIPGHSNGPVGHDQSGNPFVFKDPASSTGQAVGPGVFPPAHDQRHTATSSSSIQVGIHSGGPFTSLAWQRPVARQASGGGPHHFQLAGASHFAGTNPFSMNMPGRSHSMDGLLGVRRAADQNRQPHSAPIVPEMPAVSHFQFPLKKSIQFYLPRIKHASEQQRWEDLGYVYVAMKDENVEIDFGVLEAFFHAFENNCTQTLGECFEKFSSKIHHYLEQRMPNPEPGQSPSALLDDDDKYFFGQLGVALMYLSYSKQLFNQGYSVLHVLHNLSINYSLYTAEFGVQGRPLTTTEVALTAADMCLRLNEPVYSSALEVLRGTNYALPAAGRILSFVEADWRKGVFHTLCEHFLSTKEFHVVSELLDNVGDIEIFGSVEVKALYSALLHGLIKNNQIDDAAKFLKRMGENRISREPELVRALVNGFGDAGRTQDAKRQFLSGLFSGVYPPIAASVNPWTVTVTVSYSALESKLYIEKHLNTIQEFIEQNATRGRVLDDNFYRPLTVVIKSDQVPNLYSSHNYMGHDDLIRASREKVRAVLTDDFNPPLSFVPQSKEEELVVSAMSLKRWFNANPISGRFKGGSFGRATPQSLI